MEFIKIKSKEPWILKEIEQYHPDSPRHTIYWKNLKRNAIEGVWGEDFNNEFRYMPPKLWYYINFGLIQDEDRKTKARREIRPKLSDVMWELAYACMEARGFSGFKSDTNRTADKKILSFSKSSTPVSNLDTSLYFKPGGAFKDYITPRECLRSRHKEQLGCPVYDNPASNLMILGARGGGKSYYIAIAELLHEVLFDGAKEYTQHSIEHPTKVEVFLGSAIASKSTETSQKILAAHNALAIKKEFGAWGEIHEYDYEPSPFYKDMTGDIGPNNMKSPWRHEFTEKVNGRWVTGGTKSVLKHGVYTTENPQVAAGGRYTMMFTEEVGLCPNVIVSHWSNEACMRVGTRKFGSAIYAGTAGDMEKIIESQEMFENPREYNMLVYPNDWENMPNKEIGFFLPAYYTDFDFKDDNGNTNLIAAKEHYEQLHTEKRKAKNAAAYEGELMNTPIIPSHMFIKKTGNLLPIAEIDEQLRHLEYTEIYKRYETPVKLVFDKTELTGVKYIPDTKGELKPIVDFPLSNNEHNRDGCVVIYEFPKYDPATDLPYEGMYIIGHDPIKEDNEFGQSLATIYVLKTNKYKFNHGHNEIVATYIGRPYGGQEEINETLEKLAMFYGASSRMIWFERNVGETKAYFEKKQKLNLLALKPQLVFADTHKGKTGPRLIYGYSISNQHDKLDAINYLRTWLLKPHTEHQDGKVELNLHRILDRGLLKEMKMFNLEGNFDRVMGFIGCIIGLEETYNQYKEQSTRKESPITDTINFFKQGEKRLLGDYSNELPTTKTKNSIQSEKQAVAETKHRFPVFPG